MNKEIEDYNHQLTQEDQSICKLLVQEINRCLPESESKVWHGAPVWFLEGNPVVGYSKQKAGLRLMFWSGMSFNEPAFSPSESGKFKDASIFYHDVSEVSTDDLYRWLEKAKTIQWDYKNIVKRRGKLERLK